MNTHTPGTKYPAGTRYSNSEIYDEATDKVVNGFQVFRQCLPDGSPTGRESFVDNSGMLCGVEIAPIKRAEALRESTQDLLETAYMTLGIIVGYNLQFDGRDEVESKIKKVIAKAKGI